MWWKLYLMEQLNCVCNGLAKAAVMRSLMSVIPHRDKYLLPLGYATTYAGNTKSTTNVSVKVHYCLEEAEV